MDSDRSPYPLPRSVTVSTGEDERGRGLGIRWLLPLRPALLARADPAEPPAALDPSRRGGRLRRRHVLGPLRAVERAPGRVGVRVVVPRRRAGARPSLPFGVVNAPGQRYHPAIIAQAAATLSEMFPGAAVGRARAPARRPTSTSPASGWPPKARAQRAAARVRGRHARAVRRRGGHPRRPRRRRPRAAVDAARRRRRRCCARR